MHKSTKPQTETICYPTNIPPHPPHVFANYKRTAPSATISVIPTPPPLPPSPPKRKSSRNNSTLRLISTMKIRTDKSPSLKRHETCFSSSSNVDKNKVKFLRDKITCKLSPASKRKGEDKARVKITKTITTSPSFKSKLSSTLTTTRDSKTSSRTNIAAGRSDKSPERCCSNRSSSASPVRRICKQCTSDITKQPEKTALAKDRAFSLERTFGSEKKKLDISVPKDKRPRIVKSPDLLSPTEVKRAVISQLASSTSSPTYKKTTSLLSSVKNGTKTLHREPSIPIRVAYSEKGKELLKTNLRPKSLPSTPILSRSLSSRNSCSSPAPSNTSERSKTRSNISLNTIPSKLAKDAHKASSSSISKSNPKSNKIGSKETLLKTKSKAKKDVVNGEIAKKVKEKSKHPLRFVEAPKKVLKTQNHVESKINLAEIKKQKEFIKTDTFFQNLFLRNMPVVAPVLSASIKNPWITERTYMLQHRKTSVSEPSVRALKIYLNHTKPVTDSKFRSLDAAVIRSRSASPKTNTWGRKELIRKPIKKDERSSSLPPKLVFSETSRSVSPITECKRMKSDSRKVCRGNVSPTPKIIFTETSRPVSPIIQRRRHREILTSISKPKRPASPKIILTETSRPVSPIVERSNKIKKRSASPKFVFSETTRPISPLTQRRLTKRDIINAELIKRRTPSPPKLIFTETSRPVSPLVERRYVVLRELPRFDYERPCAESPKFILTETSRPISPVIERREYRIEKSKKDHKRTSSPKVILTETSRPISPVIERRIARREPCSVSPQSASVYGHKRRMSPESEQRLYFSESSRPISPIVERKSRKSPSPTLKHVPEMIHKSYVQKIRARSAGDAEVSHFEQSDPPSLTLSTSSIDSLDRREYQAYVKELLQSSRKSTKFKELNNFFSTLEKMGDLERTTSSAELRPRRKYEDEIIDFDRWKEVRTRERAERELKDVYNTLKEHQREKGLLFLPKDVETYKWKLQLDRGLRLKEKSVDNIKEEFERLKHEESEAALTKQRDIANSRDVYKPLWRGNSVVNLANSMVERRSQSEGRSNNSIQKKLQTERLLTHGIGSRIWSSLSMEQVNILKNQLNEIYSQTPAKIVNGETTDHSIDVCLEKPHSYQSPLTVRRNSDIYDPIPKSTPKLPKESKSLSSSFSTGGKQMSEIDKKKLSQSLSKEVLDRVSQLQKRTSPSLVLGKETRGAIAAAEAKVKHTEITSPRTCYSLEMSEDGQDKGINKDNDFVLVLTDKNSDKDSIKNTMEELAQPKSALLSTDAVCTVKSSNSETESSTDGSTRTVIYLGKQADVLKKVEYFENVSEREVYTPTIYKPAEIELGKQIAREDTQQNKAKKIGKLTHSQSYQDLKELFGEQEIVKLATVPLSETRRVSKPCAPNLRSTSLSPVRSTISGATSTDSIYRSRSLSPYPDDSLALVRCGDVNRLKNKFEHLEDFYSHRETLRPRRWRSDPQLNQKGIVYIPGQTYGGVDNLRRKYEYPAISGRGRSRYRRGGVVSPLYLRAEDRYMPHINIISKIASLYPRRSVSPSDEKRQSTEELAEILGIPVGEVEKLRQKFDSPDRMSLLGHMFTSSPNIQELRDISPYLAASWIAHKYPRSEDNTRSLSSPEHSISSRDTSLVRKDRHRPKSASPPRPKPKPSSILKTKDAFADQIFDPSIHRPVCRYQPSVPREESLRYRSWWPPMPTHIRPTVTFKGVVFYIVENVETTPC